MPDEKTSPQTPQPKKPMRIYAMPEKFFIEEKGTSGGNNKFLFIGIIVLVIAILGLGAYFFLQKNNQPTDDNTAVVNNANTNTVATNNANRNINNANKNSNTNVNTNKNSNSNVANINLFTNTNSNTNTSVNSNTNIQSSQDTDSDGLTDIEEAIYGTNISLPDTDGDGYVDGQEVSNGYDPMSKGKIEANGGIRLYTDTQEGYTLLYPVAWTLSEDPQNARGRMFTANGEFVEVTVQENPARLSARDWYLTKSPGIDSSRILSVTNFAKTLVGVQSLDGLTVFYTKGDKAYILNYNINILTQANYKTTFLLMYRSFNLPGSSTNTNTSSNTNVNTNTNRNVNTNSSTNSNLNNTNRL
jgi:hypothetical protein